jgi:hypothetical protein
MSYDGERGILTRRIEELEAECHRWKHAFEEKDRMYVNAINDRTTRVTRSKPYINADHPSYEEPEPITFHDVLVQAQALGMEVVFRTIKEEEEEQAEKPKGVL